MRFSTASLITRLANLSDMIEHLREHPALTTAPATRARALRLIRSARVTASAVLVTEARKAARDA